MSTDNQSPAEIEIAAMRLYLLSLGFQPIAEVGHSMAFRHLESGAVVTLTKNDGSEFVRSADLLSIKFRLEAEGLISQRAITELSQGKLPIAS